MQFLKRFKFLIRNMASKRARPAKSKSFFTFNFDNFYPNEDKKSKVNSQYNFIQLPQPSASKLRQFNDFLGQQFGHGVSFLALDKPYKVSVDDFLIHREEYADHLADKFLSQVSNRMDKLTRDKDKRNMIKEDLADSIMQFDNTVYLYPKVEEYRLANTAEYLNRFNEAVAPNQNVNPPLRGTELIEDTINEMVNHPRRFEAQTQHVHEEPSPANLNTVQTPAIINNTGEGQYGIFGNHDNLQQDQDEYEFLR